MSIRKSDSLEYLKSLEDYSQDIVYCDPPYALGSEVIIRKDGKVDYAKASDFMSKWEMPTGAYWEQWFNEAYRVLKHGGWLIMFGMDRQLLLFKYYAHLAEFEEQQSLYWYFISNFPKATDLSKMIDKNLGEEREVVGYLKAGKSAMGQNSGWNNHNNTTTPEITKPKTDLAKKYDGYKYSISPLKQTNETIMVFKKPTKTGSVLHDTLAYENGDLTISVGALNISGNRVGIREEPQFVGSKKPKSESNANCYGDYNYEGWQQLPDGRYPAQTLIDSQVAEVLDKQSGISKSQTAIKENSGGLNFGSNTPKPTSENIGYDDIGGCSKILHKCDYEQEDIDLYYYEPKVSSSERNAGVESFEPKAKAEGNSTMAHNPNDIRCTVCGKRPNTVGNEKNCCSCEEPTYDWYKQKNNHPTLKPIELNYRILSLFKTPNNQVICYPFAGAGSEIIGGIKAGFENWHGCEINQDYVDIANARIDYWKKTMWTQTDIFSFLDEV